MASDITSGVGKICKDKVGGVKNAYFVPNVDNGFTVAANVVTGLNVLITEVFKYDLLSSENNFEEVMTSSRVNGTTVAAQTVNISIKGSTAALNDQMKLVCHNYPHIIIQDYSDTYSVLGLVDGLDATVTRLSGGLKGDFKGYRIVATGEELELGAVLDSATITALLALVSAVSIDL